MCIFQLLCVPSRIKKISNFAEKSRLFQPPPLSQISKFSKRDYYKLLMQSGTFICYQNIMVYIKSWSSDGPLHIFAAIDAYLFKFDAIREPCLYERYLGSSRCTQFTLIPAIVYVLTVPRSFSSHVIKNNLFR